MVGRHALALGLTVLLWREAAAGDSATSPTTTRAASAPTPLQTVRTVAAPMSDDGYFAWADELCDRRDNVYLLAVPPMKNGRSGPERHEVLRVSADGKQRTKFRPLTFPIFAKVAELTIVSIALDPQGTLFALVWARWGSDRAAGKRGHFLVSFDQDGRYKSHLTIDYAEILPSQLEVFGSGEFLLRGIHPETHNARLMILSASGQTLEDVRRWAGKFFDHDPSAQSPPRLAHMARGGDGRIYVIQEDPGEEGEFVHAISPSGDAERLFELPVLPENLSLRGWSASGERFAATYYEGGELPRWWAAVYELEGGEPEPRSTLYGPLPGPPLCYESVGAKDRFTILKGSTALVTMSSP
jgi:hypothetical protein